jgi:hypothetical protein
MRESLGQVTEGLLWVKSGKVQTEQMVSGLCLKADARRFEGAGVSNIR